MKIYTGPDEYPIKEIPKIDGWSENFAIMYTSPEHGIAVYLSMNRWLGDPSVWRESIEISFPDGRLVYYKGFGRAATNTAAGASFAKYEILEPGMSTRFAFDGPVWVSTTEALMDFGPRPESTEKCKIDLTFKYDAPVFNMKGDSKEAATMAGSVHIDQVGTSHGSLVFEGKQYEFAGGFAVRDHSRGVRRDVTGYAGHAWLMAKFPGQRAFYVYAMKLAGSADIGMKNAAVTQGDELYHANLISTEFLTGREQLGRPYMIVLESELGRMEIEVASVLNRIPNCMVSPYDMAAGWIRHRWSASLIDEFVIMKWEGKEGYGWSERGFASQGIA
jgi:hypothetical protein